MYKEDYIIIKRVVNSSIELEIVGLYTHELSLYLNAKMCFQLGQKDYLFQY